MRAWRWRWGVALLACVASAAAGAVTLRIVTEHGPPLNMREGEKIIGASTDKIRAAMARAGIAYTIELMPWKLAYTFALNEPTTCLYSTERNPGREQSFKWIGPVHAIDWTLFARADRHLKLTSVDDARGMRIGTYKGAAPEAFLRGQGFIIDSAADITLNPGKLMAGRIDFWITSRQGGQVLLAAGGWTGKIEPVLTLKQSELYLACNRAVPDDLVASLNAAFAAMRADGSAEAIDRKYAGWRPPAKVGD